MHGDMLLRSWTTGSQEQATIMETMTSPDILRWMALEVMINI